MIRFNLIIILLTGIIVSCFGQHEGILESIRSHPVLSYGGSDLLKFDGKTYLVGVSVVEAKNKRTSMLTRIGKVKAEREVSTFINGSDITSSTESYMKEELTTVNDSSYVKTVDTFVEYIREDSEGFVKEMQPAGFWYSEDRSVFYYAIFKEVQL